MDVFLSCVSVFRCFTYTTMIFLKHSIIEIIEKGVKNMFFYHEKTDLFQGPTSDHIPEIKSDKLGVMNLD